MPGVEGLWPSSSPRYRCPAEPGPCQQSHSPSQCRCCMCCSSGSYEESQSGSKSYTNPPKYLLIHFHLSSLSVYNLSSPGVKGDSVQEGSIVMVANVIPDNCFAVARLGHQLVLNGDVIFGVMNVHQQDVIHQGGMRRNLFTWRKLS